MNILIYGANGWIGGMIADTWSKMFPKDIICRSKTRITHANVDIIENEIKWAHRVFTTIGRTSGTKKDGTFVPNIDYLEENLFENARDNIFAPMLLAQLCKKYNKHLSYLGTGCIFSRNTRENDYVYTEENVPDFFGSAYSTIKGFTDTLMKQFDNVLNIRIRMPITGDWNPKNFIAKIVNFKKICNYPNSMTYLPNLIPMMINMARMNYTGTYNFVNGEISHKEILDMYKEIVDPTHTYELIEEKELDTMLSAKRSNNVLSTDKLKLVERDKTLIDLDGVRDLKECVREALVKMKELKK